MRDDSRSVACGTVQEGAFQSSEDVNLQNDQLNSKGEAPLSSKRMNRIREEQSPYCKVLLDQVFQWKLFLSLAGAGPALLAQRFQPVARLGTRWVSGQQGLKRACASVATRMWSPCLPSYRTFHSRFKGRERIIRSSVQTISINTKFPKRPTDPDLTAPAKLCKNKD